MDALREAAGMEFAVYDMDGVITAGDTFARFARPRCRRVRRRQVKRFLTSVAGDIRSEVRLPLRVVLIRAAVVAALEGMSEGEYLSHIEAQTLDWAQAPGWVNRELVREIEAKRAQGVFVVVATACERRLAEAMLRAAGVPYDALSASLLEVDGARHHWAISDYRIGQRKAEALQEEGLDLATASFTTDSVMDVPTARRCAHTAVVCPVESQIPERFVALGISASRWRPEGWAQPPRP